VNDSVSPADEGENPVPDETEEEAGPTRRCVVTGAVCPKSDLLRFVVGPEGDLVPDLDSKLPGRGLYLTPTGQAVADAVKKRSFARVARRQIEVPADLAERLETMIAARAIGLIGLARRGGQVSMGYDQVAAKLKTGGVGLLLQAADGAEGGRAKLGALGAGTGVPELAVLTAGELAAPFGRDHVVHLAVARGGIAKRLQIELARLKGFRGQDQMSGKSLEHDE
jgi:predicted RNA-binding protein YlxR (DUF448 family)